MDRLPAFCLNCGLIFPSALPVGIISQGNLQDCPNCGEMASIADTLFSSVRKAYTILRNPTFEYASVQGLRNILNEARSQGMDRENLKQSIIDDAPAFKTIADILPVNRSELYTFLTLLLMFLEFLRSGKDDRQETNIYNIYNQYNYEYVDKRRPVPQFYLPENNDSIHQDTVKKVYVPRPELQKEKKAKNKMCDCGSGKLFRYCHGFKK